MIYPPPSVASLVSAMRKHGNHSAKINFTRLAAGQPWTTEKALRIEFLRQEQAESLTAVVEAGVDE